MVITKDKLYLALLCICGIIAIIVFGRASFKTQGVLADGKSPKSLTYALATNPKNLDPALADDIESAKVIVNIFEGLVKYAPGKNEIEPALATKWEVSQDGKEWIFTLREDVVFHDGTPFNADAVRFSVDRQLKATTDTKMPYAKFVFGLIENIEIIDEYKVGFKLKHLYAPFLYNLAMPFSAPIVSPGTGENGENLIGTGPFQYASRGNNTITLKANTKYWGDPPQLDFIQFKIIPDSSMRMQSLETEAVDIVDGLTHRELGELDGNQIVVSTTRTDISYMGMFNNKKPFNDPKVRKAVSMAIDREKITVDLFNDRVKIANSPLPPTVMGHSPELKPYPYNPQLAKKMLREAGYTELEITLLTYANKRPYNPIGGKELAQYIKKDLEEIGVKVKVTSLPWDDYKMAIFEQKGSAFLYGWVSDNGDPDNFLYPLFTSSQIEKGLNTCKYTNSQVDFLLSAAQQETDPKTRENMYFQVQQIIIQDAPLVFLNHGMEFAAVSPDVKAFVLQPNGFSYLHSTKK
ncbi:MAG TPA: ABC transporter substrate-binding protein [Clostridia bacterium]|nr:ABC transporter substrate-binding protein [Clostridia bacterium]